MKTLQKILAGMFITGLILAPLGYKIKNTTLQSFGAGIGMGAGIAYISYMLTEYNPNSDNTRKKPKK